jgi:hypothetical protein
MDVLNPDKSIIYLNSSNRASGTSSNFTIDLRSQILTPNNYDTIVLTNAAIPKSFYTINSSNNTFLLNENGSIKTVTIVIGNYNSTNLATQIGVQMTAVSTIGATYTVVLSVTTGKYTITTTSALTTSVSFVNYNFCYICGFDQASYSFVAKTLTSVNIVNLQFTTSIIIGCSLCDNNAKILSVVIPNQSDYSVITYQETCPGYVSVPMVTSSASSVSFWLQDEYGKQLDLNGIDFTATIIVYKQDTYHKTALIDKRLKFLERSQ